MADPTRDICVIYNPASGKGRGHERLERLRRVMRCRADFLPTSGPGDGETLALEAADAGIDVNAVAPGALATRLLRQAIEAGPEHVGAALHRRMLRIRDGGGTPLSVGARLCVFLASAASDGITGKLISAPWDRWQDWPQHLEELRGSDVYTLRRITGRERGMPWGDA
jgi:hypothetical protein